MGEARRKKLTTETRRDIKIAPRRLASPVDWVHQQRVEQVAQDGATYVINLYMAVDRASGRPHAEETPEGQMPVVIQSVPMLVKRAPRILSGPTLIGRA